MTSWQGNFIHKNYPTHNATNRDGNILYQLTRVFLWDRHDTYLAFLLRKGLLHLRKALKLVNHLLVMDPKIDNCRGVTLEVKPK